MPWALTLDSVLLKAKLLTKIACCKVVCRLRELRFGLRSNVRFGDKLPCSNSVPIFNWTLSFKEAVVHLMPTVRVFSR